MRRRAGRARCHRDGGGDCADCGEADAEHDNSLRVRDRTGSWGAGQLAGACGWLTRLERGATAARASEIRLATSPDSAPALLTAIAISAETTLTVLAARAAAAPQGRQRSMP